MKSNWVARDDRQIPYVVIAGADFGQNDTCVTPLVPCWCQWGWEFTCSISLAGNELNAKNNWAVFLHSRLRAAQVAGFSRGLAVRFLKDSKYVIVCSVIFRAMPQTCTTLLEMVFRIFFFLILEPVKNCKLPQLSEIQRIKMCVFMNFYGYVKNQPEMKMVFVLLQSSAMWWSQEILWPLVVSACPHCKRRALLSNIQKCMRYLGTWASILQNFSCVPKQFN